ncbi:TOBE domain-containing protein [Streptomyces cyaneofuscatus]|uniref:TOBE domain-containing protein n=1 Tax=Streptomyces cyaneofuscatus TaxID=66883 RepID=UPI0036965239
MIALDIATGGAMASVKAAVAGGQLTAAITKDAVHDLGRTVGAPVTALVKCTEVSSAVG